MEDKNLAFHLGREELRDVDLKALNPRQAARHKAGDYSLGGPEPSQIQQVIEAGGGYSRYHGQG